MCVYVMGVYAYECLLSSEARGTGVTSDSEPPDVRAGNQTVSLEEQYMPFTMEPSL